MTSPTRSTCASMRGNCGRRSKPIPSARTIFWRRPASATACGRRT